MNPNLLLPIIRDFSLRFLYLLPAQPFPDPCTSPESKSFMIHTQNCAVPVVPGSVLGTEAAEVNEMWALPSGTLTPSSHLEPHEPLDLVGSLLEALPQPGLDHHSSG